MPNAYRLPIPHDCQKRIKTARFVRNRALFFPDYTLPWLYLTRVPNHAVMNYDSVNDVVVLNFHRWQLNPIDGDVQPGPESRGLYVYDPAANSWTETPLAMPKEIGLCPSGFYNPDLNAHFIHVAGDSDDNGSMWVYRYKRTQGQDGS